MSLGIKSSAFLRVEHPLFPKSGIVFLKKFLQNLPSNSGHVKTAGTNILERFLIRLTPLIAKDLMPRDIMPSEPRHWMISGQLVMAVQGCAETWRRRSLSTAPHRHVQLAKYHPVPWLRWHNVSWHAGPMGLPRKIC